MGKETQMSKTFEKTTWPSGKVQVIAKLASGKIWKNYLFQTDERAENWIQSVKDSDEAAAARKLAKAEAKKKAYANLVNPFKVGDIFYDSWGYEQTNIDFYQVVAVGPKSVTLRELASEQVESTGWASGRVVPKVGEFTGPPALKKLQVLVNPDGTAGEPYVKSRHGWISKWDGTPKHYTAYA
jgi:hypothetical protein